MNEPLLDGNEEKYVLECIRTGWISSEGPFVQRFESEMSKYVHRRYGVAVSSGTAALDIAFSAIGIGPGDEVIMPAFTIISCVQQVLRSGATPVFVDCDLKTWNMDADQVRTAISKRTKAILMVHIYGLPSDVDAILEIADAHNLIVIEDAAEAHGQFYKDRPCGSFGGISIFSFYANKHVTTGEGGMVLTDNEEYADRCRSLRNLCFEEHQRFMHKSLGWNYRMTNLQAALGVAQLEQLPKFIERKKRMGALYTKFLQDIDGVQLPLERTDYAENHYWVFGILLSPNLGLTAATVMKRLAERGIGTRPFFFPLNKQPVILDNSDDRDQECPNAEHLYKYGFYVPSGLALTEEQIGTVASEVEAVLQ